MAARLAAIVVTVCLCAPRVSGQAPAELTRQQRELLQGLVAAVDRAAPTTPDVHHEWLTHTLRASDGSHYVAFSVSPPADRLPASPIVLYVRLATAVDLREPALVERSMVREWLQGSRVDPRLLPQRRGVAIGDMPAMGAGAIGARGAASVGSGDLQALALQRERARERREEEERQRRAALEGSAGSESNRLPFEDFDLGRAAVFADGSRAIQRALTAGPGRYELSVAWADASQPVSKARYHVARRSLRLAPAVPEFGISSIIVADGIGIRPSPYDPLQQRAHPYAIGSTEITPARDAIFTPAQQIAVAFQIVNPMPSAAGKPDVRITPRITRLNGTREEPVATLSPLIFDTATLPPEFDVRLGHPLIAAFAAPLATIPRGDYRLQITAEDRAGSSVVAARTEFTVVGTPVFFQVGFVLLIPLVFTVARRTGMSLVKNRLTRPEASPVLTRALDSARAGRFADLLVADNMPDAEQGARAALSGLALVSLANPAAIGELQRAVQAEAPAAAVQVLMGAARAIASRENEAIAAWEAARDAGFPKALLDPLIAEAYLRQKDFGRAASAIADRPADAAALMTFAATRIATRRPADAVAALDALLARQSDDQQARWLLLHALYAEFVGGDHSVTARLKAEAERYHAGKGPHGELLAEWLKVIGS